MNGYELVQWARIEPSKSVNFGQDLEQTKKNRSNWDQVGLHCILILTFMLRNQ